MNEYPLKKFIDLIEYDQGILRLEKQLGEYEYAIDVATNEINACQTSLQNMKVTKHTFRKEVDAKELEMKTLDAEEKKKKAQMDQAANHQEYKSLEAGINLLKKKQHLLEEELVSAWKHFENFEREYEEKKKFCDEQAKVHDEVIKEKMRASESLKKELQEHMQQRNQKEQGIPSEWLERYTAMRTRVDNPVVALNHESCSACFYRVPQKNLMELKRGKLINCPDCFRFLYVKDFVAESSREQ